MPAEFGLMDERVHRSIITLQNWMNLRDAEFERILGPASSRNMLYQEVVITCLAEFGRGLREPIKFYQDHCAHVGRRTTIRNSIYDLAGRGLLYLGTLPEDGRATLVSPTVRLVGWAMASIPSLEAALPSFFLPRTDMS